MDHGKVVTDTLLTDSREWLAGPTGAQPGENPTIVLDYSLFPAGLRTNGYVPSGCVLGKVTATGFYGPYDSTASDGRQTAAGLLFQAEVIKDTTHKGSNALYARGVVYTNKLPFSTGAGGATAAAKTALNQIYFS